LADAGSTRANASDLGSVQDSVALNGSLSFRDRLDQFRFDIARDGAVEIDLTGLSQNVDLLLTDETGSLLETSRQRGRTSESISTELDAGTYFAAVQSRSFWGSRYRLNLTVDFTAPSAESEVVVDPVVAPKDSPSPLSDVPYFGGSREWNVNAVKAPEAWAAGYTGAGITVAVVDTGVDLDHPDLVNNLFVNPGEIRGNGIDDDGNGYIDDVHGYDFAGRDANPNDVGGHGTHVAGSIAAGLNGFGATGIAPDATILPVRVLGNNGSGSTNAVAAGIRYAAEQGADIINLSLGGGYSRLIQSAIDYAQDLGSLIIAAAGNESSSVPGYPARFSANYNNVISVGAHNSSNQIARFSNGVGNSGSVQIDAPGVGVFSTYVGGRLANLSGTSMAAPQVAGVAALALSANPNLAPSQLRSLLVGGTTTLAAGSDALGIVNAATTVAYAAAGLTAAPAASASGAVSNAIGNGNARSFRVISFDGIIVSSDILATRNSDVKTDVFGEETPTIQVSVTERIAESEFTLSVDANPELIDVAMTAQENDQKATDVHLEDDVLNSLV
jgi:subtilisin family serine protease